MLQRKITCQHRINLLSDVVVPLDQLNFDLTMGGEVKPTITLQILSRGAELFSLESLNGGKHPLGFTLLSKGWAHNSQ